MKISTMAVIRMPSLCVSFFLAFFLIFSAIATSPAAAADLLDVIGESLWAEYAGRLHLDGSLKASFLQLVRAKAQTVISQGANGMYYCTARLTGADLGIAGAEGMNVAATFVSPSATKPATCSSVTITTGDKTITENYITNTVSGVTWTFLKEKTVLPPDKNCRTYVYGRIGSTQTTQLNWVILDKASPTSERIYEIGYDATGRISTMTSYDNYFYKTQTDNLKESYTVYSKTKQTGYTSAVSGKTTAALVKKYEYLYGANNKVWRMNSYTRSGTKWVLANVIDFAYGDTFYTIMMPDLEIYKDRGRNLKLYDLAAKTVTTNLAYIAGTDVVARRLVEGGGLYGSMLQEITYQYDAAGRLLRDAEGKPLVAADWYTIASLADSAYTIGQIDDMSRYAAYARPTSSYGWYADELGDHIKCLKTNIVRGPDGTIWAEYAYYDDDFYAPKTVGLCAGIDKADPLVHGRLYKAKRFLQDKAGSYTEEQIYQSFYMRRDGVLTDLPVIISYRQERENGAVTTWTRHCYYDASSLRLVGYIDIDSAGKSWYYVLNTSDVPELRGSWPFQDLATYLAARQSYPPSWALRGDGATEWTPHIEGYWRGNYYVRKVVDPAAFAPADLPAYQYRIYKNSDWVGDYADFEILRSADQYGAVAYDYTYTDETSHIVSKKIGYRSYVWNGSLTTCPVSASGVYAVAYRYAAIDLTTKLCTLYFDVAVNGVEMVPAGIPADLAKALVGKNAQFAFKGFDYENGDIQTAPVSTIFMKTDTWEVVAAPGKTHSYRFVYENGQIVYIDAYTNTLLNNQSQVRLTERMVYDGAGVLTRRLVTTYSLASAITTEHRTMHGGDPVMWYYTTSISDDAGSVIANNLTKVIALTEGGLAEYTFDDSRYYDGTSEKVNPLATDLAFTALSSGRIARYLVDSNHNNEFELLADERYDYTYYGDTTHVATCTAYRYAADTGLRSIEKSYYRDGAAADATLYPGAVHGALVGVGYHSGDFKDFTYGEVVTNIYAGGRWRIVSEIADQATFQSVVDYRIGHPFGYYQPNGPGVTVKEYDDTGRLLAAMTLHDRPFDTPQALASLKLFTTPGDETDYNLCYFADEQVSLPAVVEPSAFAVYAAPFPYAGRMVMVTSTVASDLDGDGDGWERALYITYKNEWAQVFSYASTLASLPAVPPSDFRVRADYRLIDNTYVLQTKTVQGETGRTIPAHLTDACPFLVAEVGMVPTTVIYDYRPDGSIASLTISGMEYRFSYNGSDITGAAIYDRAAGGRLVEYRSRNALTGAYRYYRMTYTDAGIIESIAMYDDPGGACREICAFTDGLLSTKTVFSDTLPGGSVSFVYQPVDNVGRGVEMPFADLDAHLRGVCVASVPAAIVGDEYVGTLIGYDPVTKGERWEAVFADETVFAAALAGHDAFSALPAARSGLASCIDFDAMTLTRYDDAGRSSWMVRYNVPASFARCVAPYRYGVPLPLLPELAGFDVGTPAFFLAASLHQYEYDDRGILRNVLVRYGCNTAFTDTFVVVMPVADIHLEEIVDAFNYWPPEPDWLDGVDLSDRIMVHIDSNGPIDAEQNVDGIYCGSVIDAVLDGTFALPAGAYNADFTVVTDTEMRTYRTVDSGGYLRTIWRDGRAAFESMHDEDGKVLHSTVFVYREDGTPPYRVTSLEGHSFGIVQWEGGYCFAVDASTYPDLIAHLEVVADFLDRNYLWQPTLVTNALAGGLPPSSSGWLVACDATGNINRFYTADLCAAVVDGTLGADVADGGIDLPSEIRNSGMAIITADAAQTYTINNYDPLTDDPTYTQRNYACHDGVWTQWGEEIHERGSGDFLAGALLHPHNNAVYAEYRYFHGEADYGEARDVLLNDGWLALGYEWPMTIIKTWRTDRREMKHAVIRVVKPVEDGYGQIRMHSYVESETFYRCAAQDLADIATRLDFGFELYGTPAASAAGCVPGGYRLHLFDLLRALDYATVDDVPSYETVSSALVGGSVTVAYDTETWSNRPVLFRGSGWRIGVQIDDVTGVLLLRLQNENDVTGAYTDLVFTKGNPAIGIHYSVNGRSYGSDDVGAPLWFTEYSHQIVDPENPVNTYYASEKRTAYIREGLTDDYRVGEELTAYLYRDRETDAVTCVGGYADIWTWNTATSSSLRREVHTAAAGVAPGPMEAVYYGKVVFGAASVADGFAYGYLLKQSVASRTAPTADQVRATEVFADAGLYSDVLYGWYQPMVGGGFTTDRVAPYQQDYVASGHYDAGLEGAKRMATKFYASEEALKACKASSGYVYRWDYDEMHAERKNVVHYNNDGRITCIEGGNGLDQLYFGYVTNAYGVVVNTHVTMDGSGKRFDYDGLADLETVIAHYEQYKRTASPGWRYLGHDVNAFAAYEAPLITVGNQIGVVMTEAQVLAAGSAQLQEPVMAETINSDLAGVLAVNEQVVQQQAQVAAAGATVVSTPAVAENALQQKPPEQQ